MYSKPIDPEAFLALYNAGKSRAQIAEELGVQPESLRFIRYRLGLPPFQRTPRNVVPERALRELQAQGLTVTQAAERLGFSESAIYRAIRRYGIPSFAPKPRKGIGSTPKFDRELFKMLDAANMSARQISERMGCSTATVLRMRREIGRIQKSPEPHSQETRDRARQMLNDGASYNETGRTLKVSVRWLRMQFPGQGWTHKQAIEYRNMKKEMDRLDGKMRTPLSWT